MDNGKYRISIDGVWDLRDLYEFPHAYLQTYAFTYAFDTELPPRDIERVDTALESYPWGDGYSIVNIYTVLQNQVRLEFRPRIGEIRYASPGWIDLYLNLLPAVKIAGAVSAIAYSVDRATKAYTAVQDLLSSVRARAAEARIKHIQLTRQEIYELQCLAQDLANVIGFERLSELGARAGNIEVTAKLLAAQYRRLKTLADFVIDGKAKLPSDPSGRG